MAYESPIEHHLVKADLLTYIYPVGSIYMTWGATSPATFLGGTWTQIQDTFLMCAGSTYTAGTTGGAATQTLTSSNLPSHSHTASGNTGNESANHTHTWSASSNSNPGDHTDYLHYDAGLWFGGSTRLSVHGSGAATSINPATGAAGSHNHSVGGTSSGASANHTHNWSSFSSGGGNGSGSSFGTLPTYRAVTIWKRTA